jgi:hypothetical protein
MVVRPFILRVCAGTALVTLAVPVHAESTSSPPGSQAAESEYDGHIDAALRFVESRDWEKAKAEFARAHAAVPSARALRGLGVVSYQMGDYPESYRLLTSAIVEPSRPLDEALCAATEALMVHIGEHVAFYFVRSNPEGTETTIDGRSAILDARGAMVVAPGKHVLVISANGYESQSVELSTTPGTTERLFIELRRHDQSLAPAVKQVKQGSPVVAARKAERGRGAAPITVKRGRTVTWIALGTAPLFALGSGLAWTRAGRIGDGLSSSCARDRCSADERDRRVGESSLATYETLTNVGLVLVGASVVTAAIAYFVEGHVPARPLQGSAADHGMPLGVRF